MFEYADFTLRNPAYALKHWRNQPEVRRNMLEFRNENAANGCVWCGRTGKLDVHHKIPVAVNPYMAHVKANMAMLCSSGCHLVIGHNRNYATRYEQELDDVCAVSEVIDIRKFNESSTS